MIMKCRQCGTNKHVFDGLCAPCASEKVSELDMATARALRKARRSQSNEDWDSYYVMCDKGERGVYSVEDFENGFQAEALERARGPRQGERR